MSDFAYISASGERVELDGQLVQTGKGLKARSRASTYELTKSGIANFARTARAAALDLTATYEEADRLRSLADLDLSSGTPGTAVARGEWRQRAFITSQDVSDVAFGRIWASLEMVLLDGWWWRTRSVPFVIVEDTDSGAFLDYPHGYEIDYGRGSLVKSVDVDASAACDVLLTVYGPAVNPYVIVGANRYQVNVTVPEGSRLVVDGMMKEITLVSRDGSETSCFGDGVRETGEGGGRYVFEKLSPGTQAVAWDNSFGFDLGWYERSGEPPWTR